MVGDLKGSMEVGGVAEQPWIDENGEIGRQAFGESVRCEGWVKGKEEGRVAIKLLDSQRHAGQTAVPSVIQSWFLGGEHRVNWEAMSRREGGVTVVPWSGAWCGDGRLEATITTPDVGVEKM